MPSKLSTKEATKARQHSSKSLSHSTVIESFLSCERLGERILNVSISRKHQPGHNRGAKNFETTINTLSHCVYSAIAIAFQETQIQGTNEFSLL